MNNNFERKKLVSYEYVCRFVDGDNLLFTTETGIEYSPSLSKC